MTICLHHNDLDGRCSGSLVERYSKEPGRFLAVEMDYTKNVPFDIIEPNETVYIVDFSLSPEDMTKLLEITKNVIWIDHHKTAIEKLKDFDLKGLREIGYAGCELTYRYFSYSINNSVLTNPPRHVTLIGRYDVFDFEEGSDPECFYYACMMHDNKSTNHAFWDMFFGAHSVPVIDNMIKDGRVIKQYRSMFYNDCIDAYGFETEFEGHKAIVFNAGHTSSIDFGDKRHEYDIMITFYFNGNQFNVSLYSEKVDVSEIAKKYGGGGHTGASGYKTDTLPFTKTK